ncbi:MAG TPA: FecR domain-containing protein [Mucilaginibacter sp.]|nr:FecR domain-containing protein [Mucilaginibacter sp.]
MTEQEIARLRLLADKYLKNTISDSERAELEAWFREQHDEPLDIPTDFAENEEALEHRIFNTIQAKANQKQEARTIRLWPRIAVAASVLIVLSFGSYFLLHKKQPQQQVAQNQIHDIAPGHNQATLTLANGQKIILVKGLSGNLAQQGNTLVQVNNANAITYTSSDRGDNGPVQYNTMSTRRGEQSPYPLVLADGTKVWLNASSSITFPTAFNGNERTVKITGEAYFEVVHDAAHPFKVTFNNQTVEDIGTSFDINAYDDEPTNKTTLITGSVKVSSYSSAVVLKPGQVAVNGFSGKIIIKNGDPEEAISWKNGYFLFDSESLESVMRKVSRWYDVDVVYTPGQQMDERYLGSISRFSNVSKVLSMLEMTGDVKFKIDGKKIIVQKK